MLLRAEPRRLDERVEIDDAYLGGERTGHIYGGRGLCGKTAFVAAVQTSADGQPRFMRLTPVAGFTNETIQDWATKSLAAIAHVVSDGLHPFAQVTYTGATHERHVTGVGRQAAQTPSCAGSTPCWATSKPPWPARTTRLTMPSMARATWPSLLTVSTGDLTWQRCCRDYCAPQRRLDRFPFGCCVCLRQVANQENLSNKKPAACGFFI